MPMFCSGTHRKWKKEVKYALSLWGHRLQTTETSAGACWGLKRLFSFLCNNQLLLIEPQRLEESAGRCYGDTENDEHRLPASVSPQKYAMSMASKKHSHTQTHTPTGVSAGTVIVHKIKWMWTITTGAHQEHL